MDDFWKDQEKGMISRSSMDKLGKATSKAKEFLEDKSDAPVTSSSIKVLRKGTEAQIIGKDGNPAGSMDIISGKDDSVKVKIYDKDDNVLGTETISMLNDTALNKLAKQYFDK
jgi:hypothetical protein